MDWGQDPWSRAKFYTGAGLVAWANLFAIGGPAVADRAGNSRIELFCMIGAAAALAGAAIIMIADARKQQAYPRFLTPAILVSGAATAAIALGVK